MSFMGEISKKLFFTINERKFNYDGHQVKYLLKKGKAQALCVVFSAFPKKGEMPKYNLVKNLWGGTTVAFYTYVMIL